MSTVVSTRTSDAPVYRGRVIMKIKIRTRNPTKSNFLCVDINRVISILLYFFPKIPVGLISNRTMSIA